MDVDKLLEMVEVATWALWGRCLVGNPCPATQRWYEWLKDPKPGDLVLETSTAGRRTGFGSNLKDRIGHLVRVEREWVPYGHADDEVLTQAQEDEQGYYETFWYLNTLDGRAVKWHNCNFIRVVESWAQYDAVERAGWETPTHKEPRHGGRGD